MGPVINIIIRWNELSYPDSPGGLYSQERRSILQFRAGLYRQLQDGAEQVHIHIEHFPRIYAVVTTFSDNRRRAPDIRIHVEQQDPRLELDSAGVVDLAQRWQALIQPLMQECGMNPRWVLKLHTRTGPVRTSV